MKWWLTVLWFLLAAALPSFAVDREAFTVTSYQLELQIDRNSHVLAVHGRLTLRNDSKTPQKLVALQVSSSLEWNGIALEGKLLPFVGDNYTSDIDHTGSLSEAIATLPKEVAPGAAVTLEVQYGGTVTQDGTRLTRLDAPADVAVRNDWDQISDKFTAVRGFGYVTWYPVALEAVSLSDGNAVFDAIARWKNRHQSTEFEAHIVATLDESKEPVCIATNAPGSSCAAATLPTSPAAANQEKTVSTALHLKGLGQIVPTFAIANYVELARPTIDLLHTPDHADIAKDYALAAEANDPLLKDWLGEPKQPARIIELTDPNANPYQNGAVLFTPLRQAETAGLRLLLLPVEVAAGFQSPRPWIQDGVERFLQALSVEDRIGRKAALQFLNEYREPLVKAEDEAHPKADASGKVAAEHPADNTLLNTSDELYLRGKGSFVFWMLRDMVGDDALQKSLQSYRATADKDPSYFQQLLQTNSKHKLEWFFDDWVYRDRGLPEFHVASAYSRPFLNETNRNFMVTVTVENRGRSGAEVPAMVHTPSGDKVVRILVKAGENGVGRIELPVAPKQITVNDGSVPEANLGNNVYDVPDPNKP
jgi:hypothetical protein